MSESSIVRFYVYFLAKELDVYESMGKGYFRAHSEADISEDDFVDEAIESGDEQAGEFNGWIHAFSFPAIVKAEGTIGRCLVRQVPSWGHYH